MPSGAGLGALPGLWKVRAHFCGRGGPWQKCVAGSRGFEGMSTRACVQQSTQSGHHQHSAAS